VRKVARGLANDHGRCEVDIQFLVFTIPPDDLTPSHEHRSPIERGRLLSSSTAASRLDWTSRLFLVLLNSCPLQPEPEVPSPPARSRFSSTRCRYRLRFSAFRLAADDASLETGNWRPVACGIPDAVYGTRSSQRRRVYLEPGLRVAGRLPRRPWISVASRLCGWGLLSSSEPRLPQVQISIAAGQVPTPTGGCCFHTQDYILEAVPRSMSCGSCPADQCREVRRTFFRFGPASPSWAGLEVTARRGWARYARLPLGMRPGARARQGQRQPRLGWPYQLAATGSVGLPLQWVALNRVELVRGVWVNCRRHNFCRSARAAVWIASSACPAS